MVWILVAFIVAAVSLGVYWWLRYDPTVDNPIDADRLEDRLGELGVDISTTRSPNVGLMTPLIGDDEPLDHAIHGKWGGKHAVLCLMKDRIVIGAATVGSMGADTRVVRYEWVEDLEKDYDRGGTLRIAVADEAIEITHLPRSQFETFEAELRDRLGRGSPEQETSDSTDTQSSTDSSRRS